MGVFHHPQQYQGLLASLLHHAQAPLLGAAALSLQMQTAQSPAATSCARPAAGMSAAVCV